MSLPLSPSNCTALNIASNGLICVIRKFAVAFLDSKWAFPSWLLGFPSAISSGLKPEKPLLWACILSTEYLLNENLLTIVTAYSLIYLCTLSLTVKVKFKVSMSVTFAKGTPIVHQSAEVSFPYVPHSSVCIYRALFAYQALYMYYP